MIPRSCKRNVVSQIPAIQRKATDKMIAPGELLAASRRDVLKDYGFIPMRNWLACVVMVDARDYGWLAPLKWYRHTSGGGPWYVARAVAPNGVRVLMHRLIASRHFGPCPSPQHVCEHLNGDTLDNRACNLKWSLRMQTTYQVAKRAALA